MQLNELPKLDVNDNPTDCCPRFNPQEWDNQNLHFKDKLFVKAKTRSLFHIPINMGKVFPKTFQDITQADAFSDDDLVVMSRDCSAWTGEHFFSVNKAVPGHEMVTLSGDYMTRVFEGPYRNVRKWQQEMKQSVLAAGKQLKQMYFFYTTCPKCAKYYHKNYVVAIAEVQ